MQLQLQLGWWVRFGVVWMQMGLLVLGLLLLVGSY